IPAQQRQPRQSGVRPACVERAWASRFGGKATRTFGVVGFLSDEVLRFRGERSGGARSAKPRAGVRSYGTRRASLKLASLQGDGVSLAAFRRTCGPAIARSMVVSPSRE